MLPLKFQGAIFLIWQLCVVRTYGGARPLTPEEAERIARWTENDNQNIWELSGQFEGDIVLSAESERTGVRDPVRRWPKREIPYQISSHFNRKQKKWIMYSLTEYTNKTCIRPRLRNKKDKDYVYVTGEGKGCNSRIGRQGGKQNINLNPSSKPGEGCLRVGSIVHEFLHALGFYHQHSATDRDNYVRIIENNIMKGKEGNFKKYTDDLIFGEQYDYNSIMHYSAYAFSKNKKKTIITKDPKAVIGQRHGLSCIDVAKLQKMYGCKY